MCSCSKNKSIKKSEKSKKVKKISPQRLRNLTNELKTFDHKKKIEYIEPELKELNEEEVAN